MPHARLDFALPIGILHAARQSNHAVMLQHIAVQRIERGFVNVGREDALTQGVTMFSNWFSGDDRERYRASPHKHRIDVVGRGLLDLRYANEVIRQHLHEWLSFSFHLEKDRTSSLPGAGADAVRQYVAKR